MSNPTVPADVNQLVKEVSKKLDFPLEVIPEEGRGTYRFDFENLIHIIGTPAPGDWEGFVELLSRAWACEWIHPAIGFFFFDKGTSRDRIHQVSEELKVGSTWIIDYRFFKEFPIAKTISLRGMEEEIEAFIRVLKEKRLKITDSFLVYLGVINAWIDKYGQGKLTTHLGEPLAIKVRDYLLEFDGPWDEHGFLEITNRLLEFQGKKLVVSFGSAENPFLAPLSVRRLKSK